MIIHDVFSVLIPTCFLSCWVGKPILDTWILSTYIFCIQGGPIDPPSYFFIPFKIPQCFCSASHPSFSSWMHDVVESYSVDLRWVALLESAKTHWSRYLGGCFNNWGIGIVIGDHWAAWKLSEGWKKGDRDIGWAEAITLELAMLWLVQEHHWCCYPTHSTTLTISAAQHIFISEPNGPAASSVTSN